jgi:hypothetical protein
MKYSYNDIFSDDILSGIENIKKNIAQIGTELEKAGKVKVNIEGGEKLKELEDYHKQIAAAQKSQELELKKFQALEKAYNNERKINQKTHLTQLKAEQQAKKTATNEEAKYSKEVIKTRLANQQRAKAAREAAQRELDLERASKTQIRSLRDMQNHVSRLNRRRNELDLTNEKGRATYRKLTAEMKRYNDQLKNSDKLVGRHQRNVGNYVSAIKNSFVGTAAVIGAAIASIGRIVRAVDNMVKSYEAQMLAEQKLSVIMKQRMGATDATIQSIIDLTSAQQQMGVVGDEVQLAGLQQLSTFAK